ncbi:site-2 protease family protein [Colibacter massiliensis]|uniref:site-2 protease family protein n=1 Tax=Colibacter massiliensis TaxID=1852379 RepID=UPI00266C1279|nr:site-2 protease family protein [Colibacter massiliensis]
MFNFDILAMVAGIPGLIIAMTVHEYSHARTAVAMGDDTPRREGRLTLDPIAHIDPVGLLMLFIARFGWAKPVMINPGNFRNWRRGEILVAFAGPGANFLVAFLAMGMIAMFNRFDVLLSSGMLLVLQLIVMYNINFAVFNLLPIPPLDGSRILTALLPQEWAYKLAGLERYSLLILIVLLMTNVLGAILIPVQRGILMLYQMVLSLFL